MSIDLSNIDIEYVLKDALRLKRENDTLRRQLNNAQARITELNLDIVKKNKQVVEDDDDYEGETLDDYDTYSEDPDSVSEDNTYQPVSSDNSDKAKDEIYEYLEHSDSISTDQHTSTEVYSDVIEDTISDSENETSDILEEGEIRE